MCDTKVLSIGRSAPPSSRQFEDYDVTQLNNIAKNSKLLDIIWKGGDKKKAPSVTIKDAHSLRTIRNEAKHTALLNDSQIQERFEVLKEAVKQMQKEMWTAAR